MAPFRSAEVHVGGRDIPASAIGAIAATVLSMAFLAVSLPESPYLSVSLRYDSASSGLNPDGTRFDPYGILDGDVLDEVAAEMGADADSLREDLSVSYHGTPERVVTEFSVLYDGGRPGYGREVLSKLGAAYEAKMEREYRYKSTVLEDEVSDAIGIMERLDMLEYVAESRARYMAELYDDTGKYATQKQAFNDLVERDIAKLRNLAVEKGAATNPDSVQRILEYRNRLLKRQSDTAQEQYENRLEAIRLYDATLFPTISVPTMRGGEYYIPTTKTGLDKVYLEAKSFMDAKVEHDAEIVENSYRSKQVTGPSAEVDAELKRIEKKLALLTDEAKESFEEENGVLMPFVEYEVRP